MTKFHNHAHYLLPITSNVLEYGKLIEQIDNKYIISINTNNIFIINVVDRTNYIKFFRKGEFIFEFKDIIISGDMFTRIISDQKYTFKDNKLVSTEILSSLGYIQIWPLNANIKPIKLITPLKSRIINLVDNPYIYKIALTLIVLLLLISEINHLFSTCMAASIIKLRRTKNKHVWKDLVFQVNNKVFSKKLIEKLFKQFWNKIKDQFTESNHIFILLKIKYVNKQILTIGKVQRLNKTDLNWYINFILENIEFKSEYYNETLIESIIISYGFKEGNIENKSNINPDLNFITLKDVDLPISMNPKDFGTIISTSKIENGILYVIQDSKGNTITISKFDNYNEVVFMKNRISLIKFRD